MPDYKSEYAKKLRDPRWQRKRLAILERDNWQCQKCRNGKSTLHVHHRLYMPHHDPWDYPNESLVTLCESCHEVEKEELDHYSKILIEQLREKFLSNHIQDFAIGIHGMELQYLPEIVSAAYEYALSDPKMQEFIIKKYFQHIKNRTNSDGGWK